MRPLLVCAALAAAAAAAAEAAELRIVESLAVPRTALSAGVTLGGLSDLAVVRDADGSPRLWTLTDRGPNDTATIGGERIRTLLAPDFVPSLVCLRLAAAAPGDGAADAVDVERIVPLRGASGRPCSGRPSGGDRLVRADDHAVIAADADGLDPEAIAPLADGSFWIAEEYRPALVHVGASGTVLARFVPHGTPVTGADGAGGATLPAEYARRRENRGFEALAASPAGDRLWALMQSPLDHPGRSAGTRTGNVRLLVFDPRSGRPAAEHLYRLGDPLDPRFHSHGAPPDDGKLCALATLGDSLLLVLEQDDEGLARLYAVDVAHATDVLDREARDGEALENVADLEAAGIVPATKTLVADLTKLRKRMRVEVDAGSGKGGPLKLEGLAVLDDRHVAIVNDNDFGGPRAGSRGMGRATRVWIVELPEPLPRRGDGTGS